MQEAEFTPEKNKKEVSREKFIELLRVDYPTNGLCHVVGWLREVAEGSITVDEFFEKVKPGSIWTVEEYVEKKLEPSFDLMWLSEIDKNLKEKTERINAISNELKEAIENRYSPKKIYQVVVRLGLETGYGRPIIEGFTNVESFEPLSAIVMLYL